MAAESTWSVPELHCEGCARAIRDALEGAPGVRHVKADVAGRRVRVEYEPDMATPDRLGAYIHEAAFADFFARVFPV